MDCPHCGTTFHDTWTQTTSATPMPDGKCWQMFVTVCESCKKETVEVQRFHPEGDNKWVRDGECLLVYPSPAFRNSTQRGEPTGI